MHKINLNSKQYKQEYNKYKNHKRFKLISANEFNIKERNRSYLPKIATGIFLSFLSVGIAPLFSSSVRKLFRRKLTTFKKIETSKSLSGEPKNTTEIAKAKLYHPENLIPKSQLPFDMVNLVTQFLEPRDVTNLRAVNKDWYHYISQEKILDIITAYIDAQLFSEQVVNKIHFNKKIEIINAVAKCDVNKAKFLATTLKKFHEAGKNSPFYQAILAIVKIEAETDVDAATETIKLELFPWQDAALERLEDIKIIIQARKDIEGAKEIALNHPSSDRLLLGIVAIETQTNIEGAKATASSMKENWYRDEAFTKIVKIEAQTDIESAKKTAEEIKNLDVKDEALLNIVKIEVHTDIESAKKTAEEIKDRLDSEEAFLEIIKIEAKTDMEGAEETTQKLAFNRKEAFKEIIKVEAQKDIKSAKKMAKERGFQWREELDFLKIEAQKNLESFRKTAKGMKTQLDKDRYHWVIVEAEASNNIVGAKEIAASIREDNLRSYALMTIVKEEAKKEILTAFETAKTIPDVSIKVDAFIEILQAMIQSP